MEAMEVMGAAATATMEAMAATEGATMAIRLTMAAITVDADGTGAGPIVQPAM